MTGTYDSIRVEFDDSKITQALKQLKAAGTNMQPAMLEISEYLHSQTRQHFDDAQAADGTPWATLTPQTLAKKQRKGVPVNEPLHGESLHLRDMIFPFAGVDEAGVSTGPGTEAYAATHQFGDDERNIEARPYLGLSVEDEIEILDIVNEYFEEVL